MGGVNTIQFCLDFFQLCKPPKMERHRTAYPAASANCPKTKMMMTMIIMMCILFQVLPKEQHEHRNAGPGRACVRTHQGEPGGATAAGRRRTRRATHATRLPLLSRHRADGVHRRPLRPSLRLRHATARYILQGTFDGALRDLAVCRDGANTLCQIQMHLFPDGQIQV